MRKLAPVLLTLYVIALVWCGGVARARYDAATPLVCITQLADRPMAVAETDEIVPWYPCVPAAAMQWEEGAPFVYVVDERPGYFGPEQFVRKVPITPAEDFSQTNGWIALKSASLGATQSLVAASDRPLVNGEVVRVAPEEEPSHTDDVSPLVELGILPATPDTAQEQIP